MPLHRAMAASAVLMALLTSVGLTDPEFGSVWHDGKAELDGYRLTMLRYGQPRAGQAVMVYVTEPFRERARVKADDPSRDPADVFDVLKLNLVRDFQTGIYDYNTMVSLFVRSDTFAPVKVSFSSSEWCGNVYEELLIDPGKIRHQLLSYFEGETSSGSLPRPPGGMLEDELYVRLRGLRGDLLRPGERRRLPFLASTFYRRMAHQPASWSTAELERLAVPRQVRVPAGAFSVSEYVVRVADGREGRFDVESAYPHRIVKWAWTPPRGVEPAHWLGGADSAELEGSARLAYWNLHANGDERYLQQLGLTPTVSR
ncbi:MAG: hypothetical protein E6G45_04410 [Actinobacteria bacterium]|nr:MAG: hypothetical protein E6G45_04410 [Actinomycetota bacterium]